MLLSRNNNASSVPSLSNRLKLKVSLLALILSLAGCVPTVDNVDVERYMGLWYQIATNPTPFSDDLVAVTAEYTLLEDGTVQVYNRGLENNFDGEVNDIMGKAVVVDTKTNAALRVSFPSVPFNTPFPNYLIVVLDQEEYQYAAITDPSRSSLFILSRTPTIDEEIYQFILEKLAELNVKTERLIFTPQITE